MSCCCDLHMIGIRKTNPYYWRGNGDKPHLKLWDGMWFCSDRNVTGADDTMEMAYQRWKMFADKRAALLA